MMGVGGGAHLGLGPSPPYGDTHPGIPLLATDAVSGEPGRRPALRRGDRGRCQTAARASRGRPIELPPTPCHASAADMEKKGLRDQLEAQAREIARLQGEAPRCCNWGRVCGGGGATTPVLQWQGPGHAGVRSPACGGRVMACVPAAAGSSGGGAPPQWGCRN